MGGDSFHCQHCNLTMTGREQYTQHIGGRKHLKKMKTLGLTPPAQGPANQPNQPDTPDTAGKTTPAAAAAAGYAGRFVSPTSDGQSAPSPAQFGTPTSPPAGQYGSQSAPAPGQSGTGGGNTVAPKPQVETTAEQDCYDHTAGGNSDPVMNAVKANLLGKLPTKRVAYEGRCSVCNVQYTSSTHETQHMGGQKHLKKVKLAEGLQGAGENTATFFCSYCNVRVNSLQQMDQHRLGTTHKKKVESAQKAQAGGPSPAKKKFVPSSEQFAPPPPPPMSSV